MSEIEHDAAQRLIHAFFAGELDREQAERMRDHLRDCDPCRAVYDARSEAEEQVLGTAEAASMADARVWESLRQDPALRTSKRAERSWWPAFILAPAAAAAAAIVFTLTLPPADTDAELRARGSGEVQPSVGVGVVAVDPASGQVYDARRPEGVRLDHRLRFSYSNQEGEARYLFLFGLDQEWTPYWYFPLPEEQQSIALESGPQVQQQLLPYETELQQRHRPGILSVVALFSPAPLTLGQVQALIERAQQRGAQLSSVQWPAGVRAQIIELRLTPGGAP